MTAAGWDVCGGVQAEWGGVRRCVCAVVAAAMPLGG